MRKCKSVLCCVPDYSNPDGTGLRKDNIDTHKFYKNNKEDMVKVDTEEEDLNDVGFSNFKPFARENIDPTFENKSRWRELEEPQDIAFVRQLPKRYLVEVGGPVGQFIKKIKKEIAEDNEKMKIRM